MKISMGACLFAIMLAAFVFMSEAEENSGDLIFLGTVKKIEIAVIENSLHHYVVQCRVDKILSGAFAGETFSFPIHSPARSGLEVGKQYTIVATRTAEGFDVNQLQWMK